MIIYHRPIAIADSVFHKIYGRGTHQPDINKKYNGYRVVFMFGETHIVPKEELYFYEPELFEVIVGLLLFPLTLFFDFPVFRLREVK